MKPDQIDGIKAGALAAYENDPDDDGVSCPGCQYCDCAGHHKGDAAVIQALQWKIEELSRLEQQLKERRCSGRTSRMLREAIIVALTQQSIGKWIVVVFPTEHLAENAKRMTRTIAERLHVADAMARLHFLGERQLEGYAASSNDNLIVMLDHSVSNAPQDRW